MHFSMVVTLSEEKERSNLPGTMKMNVRRQCKWKCEESVSCLCFTCKLNPLIVFFCLVDFVASSGVETSDRCQLAIAYPTATKMKSQLEELPLFIP